MIQIYLPCQITKLLHKSKPTKVLVIIQMTKADNTK